MGYLHQKWTPEEEKALTEGVAKHGVGNWKIILDDPQFSHILRSRPNTTLRDKWRYMTRATQKQIESLSTDEEMALGALGELKYGVGNWKSNQEDPEFNKCSDSGSHVVVELQEKWQNMKVEASMPQPAIQDRLNVEFNQIAECKRRPPKRKMSEMRSEFDANAQAETDAEEESEAKAEVETEAEAKTEAGPSESTERLADAGNDVQLKWISEEKKGMRKRCSQTWRQKMESYFQRFSIPPYSPFDCFSFRSFFFLLLLIIRIRYRKCGIFF